MFRRAGFLSKCELFMRLLKVFRLRVRDLDCYLGAYSGEREWSMSRKANNDF